MTGNFYQFGPFRVLPELRQLRRDGQLVPLTDREFDTLHAIVRRGGDPVSKETLLAEVWHDVNANVDPNNLPRQIANLRKKMGPDETGEHYIRTITGQGYYVLGVSVHAPPSQPVESSSHPGTDSPITPSGSAERPRRGLTFRRGLAMAGAAGAACAVALGVATLFSHFEPREIHVTAYRRLTNDGKRKVGPLVTDGQRIFFSELMADRRVIASIPAAGGDVSMLDLPVESPKLLDISLERNALLLTPEDGRNRLLAWQLRTRSLRDVPRPAYLSEIGAASWDSSGNRIALASKDELTVFRPSSPTEALRHRLPGFVGVPRWDREGNRWRFDVYDGKADTYSWWDLSGDGRSPNHVPVLSGIPRESHGSWADHNRYYIFQVYAQGHSDLWLADGRRAAAATAQRLTNGPLNWDSAVASVNSQTIFAIGIQARGELSRIGGSNGGGGEALLGGLPGYGLEYSRDQQWVAFTRYPEHTIWRSKPDGTGAQQLTPNDIEAHQPHWSPDGTRIAFMGKKAGSQTRWRIYIVPGPGGALDEALPEGDDQGVPTWSADGRFVIFGDISVPEGFYRAAIHKLDLRTRAVSAIRAPVGLWSPRMSPDGRYLVAVSYDSRSLFVRDSLSDTWTRLTGMEFLEEPAWSLDSSWIHFLGHPGNSRKALFRIRPTGGHSEETADLTGLENLGATWVGVAPDGSPLMFRGTTSYEVYALDWKRR